MFDNNSTDDSSYSENHKKFLAVSSALIDAALSEAFGDANELGDLLAKLDDAAKNIEISQTSQDSHDTSHKENEINQLSKQSIVKLQFIDRIEQRLSNVKKNCQLLASFIESNEGNLEDNFWPEFIVKARQGFTMESEKVIFDNFFQRDNTVNHSEENSSINSDADSLGFPSEDEFFSNNPSIPHSTNSGNGASNIDLF